MKALRYFVYGSNMDLEQMHERCPASELMGSALLRRYDLHFNKLGKDQTAKANILPAKHPGARVLGVVYKAITAI